VCCHPMLRLSCIHYPHTHRPTDEKSDDWAHSMGPQRSPLSHVVVVGIGVAVDIDAQAVCDSGDSSDTW